MRCINVQIAVVLKRGLRHLPFWKVLSVGSSWW